MKSRTLRSDGLLLLAAVIWGFAFVAQRVGMTYVGPFTFNGVRFALGSLALLPLIALNRRRAAAQAQSSPPEHPAHLILWGILAGTILFGGASLQQVGIVYTTAGKAGFITGLYVVLVPLLGLVWGGRPGIGGFGGALLAATGLYLLSVTGRLELAPGDGLVLGSAFFFAAHVLLIGRLTAREARQAILELAALQFATCALFSLVWAVLIEEITLAGLRGAAIPILYGGFLSVSVAYTLQVVAQKEAPTTHAAILLSLEAVFAALGGCLLLGEVIPPRGLFGCALMLGGALLSQLGAGAKHRPGKGAAASGGER